MLCEETTKNIIKILLYTIAMLVIMVAIFALFGYFNIQVILGALLGGAVASVNLLFLAFAVEKSVRGDANARLTMASSYSLRLIFIAVAVVFAIKSPYINYLAMVIPLTFPRIAIFISNIFKKKEK